MYVVHHAPVIFERAALATESRELPAASRLPCTSDEQHGTSTQDQDQRHGGAGRQRQASVTRLPWDRRLGSSSWGRGLWGRRNRGSRCRLRRSRRRLSRSRGITERVEQKKRSHRDRTRENHLPKHTHAVLTSCRMVSQARLSFPIFLLGGRCCPVGSKSGMNVQEKRARVNISPLLLKIHPPCATSVAWVSPLSLLAFIAPGFFQDFLGSYPLELMVVSACDATSEFPPCIALKNHETAAAKAMLWHWRT